MEFTEAELEILSWSLDDHATKLLILEREHSYSLTTADHLVKRPNIAYLDTMILKHRVEDELVKRRTEVKSDPRTHPDHCLCDEHFTGLRPKEMQAEMDRRILRSHELAMARKAADGS